MGGLQTWGAYQHYGDPYFGIDRPAPATRPLSPTSKKAGNRRHRAAKPRVEAKNELRTSAVLIKAEREFAQKQTLDCQGRFKGAARF
jgi:hypothetical protein